jgi:isoleucyl-tRNA synthetase
VDGEGRKMSKSLGNGIDPDDITGVYGADILRLWVASCDYHSDVRLSQDILKQIAEVYRKIRNTARYMLGNLSDFAPDTDSVADADLLDLDRWALARLDQLLAKTREAYDRYDFHAVYSALNSFCTIDLSNFYLDVIKDRLYTEQADGTARRAAQTAMYRILTGLTLTIAPILCFTAEEIWSFAPKSKAWNPESVLFNEIPVATGQTDEAFLARWDRIIAVRTDVNKALELSRAEKKIGKSLEAKVVLTCDGELYDFLAGELANLPTIFIVSGVTLERGTGGAVSGEVEGLGVTVETAPGTKCERCWCVSESVGTHADHPALCDRCHSVMTAN